MNKIQVYRHNSLTVVVTLTITGTVDIDTLTAVLTVKPTYNDADEALLTASGTIDSVHNTVTFNLLPDDTDIDPGLFMYDVVLYDTNYSFTVVQDEFEVLNSVLY